MAEPRLYVGKPTVTITNLMGSQEPVILTGTEDATEVTQMTMTLPLIQDHIYHFSCEVAQTDLSCSVDFYCPVAEPVFVSGIKATRSRKWLRIGGNNIRASWSSGNYSSRIDNNNANTTGTISYRNFVFVDLTASFGSGNEPNVNWCLKNIPYFESTGQVPDPRSGASSLARRVKKMYVGTVTCFCENLVPDGDMENSSWSGGVYDTSIKNFGSQSQAFVAENTRVMSNPISTLPIVGHKYYGRHYLKTDGNVTVEDGRFEIYGGDGAGLNFVFGWNRGNYPNWTMESSIVTVTEVNASSYVCRSFTVNATGKVWVDGLMIIDLTDTFGSGYEPSKEWCDENIPFFTGMIEILNPRPTSTYNTSVARRIKKLYVGINNIAKLIFKNDRSYPVEFIGHTKSLSAPKKGLASTSIGNYALFGGGRKFVSSSSDTQTFYNTIDAFDTSLTRSNPTSLTTGVYGLGAISNGNYAFFAGGAHTSVINTVNAYNSSLTKYSPTSLTDYSMVMGRATVGNYALFAGGYGGGVKSSVNAYNNSRTKSSPTALSVARYRLSYGSIGNYAIFMGGINSSSEDTDTIDCYDSSLTRTSPSSLTITEGAYQGLVSVGNYLLGGRTILNSSLTAFSTPLPSLLDSSNAAKLNEYGIWYTGISREIKGKEWRHEYIVIDSNLTFQRLFEYKCLFEGSVHCSATVGNYALFGGLADGDYFPNSSRYTGEIACFDYDADFS